MPIIAELTGDENVGENSRTFVFENEGHTLGNILKSIICRYPEVLFCAYTVPHPAENKMHFRIQAQKETKAIDILRRGLEDVQNICDTVTDKFKESMDNREPE